MFGIRRKKQGMYGGALGMPNPHGPPITPQEPQGEAGFGSPAMGAITQPMEPQGNPGFFDKGGMGQYALAAVSDFVDRRQGNNPQALAGMMQQQQYERMQAAKIADQQRAASMKRQNDMADWQAKEQWKLDNPAPANNDTIADFEWYKGLSPEDKAVYREMKPEYRQGADGRFYRIDTGGGATTAPPSKPVGKLRPVNAKPAGGASSNASGGF